MTYRKIIINCCKETLLLIHLGCILSIVLEPHFSWQQTFKFTLLNDQIKPPISSANDKANTTNNDDNIANKF